MNNILFGDLLFSIREYQASFLSRKLYMFSELQYPFCTLFHLSCSQKDIKDLMAFMGTFKKHKSIINLLHQLMCFDSHCKMLFYSVSFARVFYNAESMLRTCIALPCFYFFASGLLGFVLGIISHFRIS